MRSVWVLVPADAGMGRILVVRETLIRWGQQHAEAEMLITVVTHTATHTNGPGKDFPALAELRPWLVQGPAKMPSRGPSALGKVPAPRFITTEL